jgi:TonB family protein
MASILIGITILLGAAYCATAVLQGSSAARRHVIWTCAIAATLLFAPLRWRAPQRVISRSLPAVFTPTITVGAHREDNTPTFSEIALSIWALGSALVGLRLFLSAVQFRRVVHKAHPFEIMACPIPILISPHIPGPMVCPTWVTGILRPVILLPEDASTWAPSRRRAVLAHELAHVRRRDPMILLAAHLATIVYWFHPLCWLAAARLRIESERACDDAALRIGLLPSGYAGHLLDLARMFNPQPAIPMATTSHLESRVKSILDPFVNRSFAARRTWLAAALITAAVMAPLTVLSLHAQATGGGNIVGKVADPTGAVVPRAQVIATNWDAHITEVATSGPVGGFAFDNIPAGSYTIEVSAPGFAVARMDNLILVNGGTLRAEANLVVGTVGENIRVVPPGALAIARQVAPAASAGPIRVGGNVQSAKLIQQVQPIYPPGLQAQGMEGTVVLSAVISKEGAPLNLHVQKSAGTDFDEAALKAVGQWRYQSTLLNGEPAEVLTTITIDFKLQQ